MEELKKYTRLGRIQSDNNSSRAVTAIETAFPADFVMPVRWAYKSPEKFTKRYGDHRACWAHATSASMLILHAQRVLRVWTDAQNSVVVDVSDPLSGYLAGKIEVTALPETLYKKTTPFTKRVELENEGHVALIIESIRSVYGVDVARV
jgi:hypothetical protein